MDSETLEALKGSIAKWKAIVAGIGSDAGLYDCPLCALFHPRRRPEATSGAPCDGCPVKQHTGKSYCEGSPYDHWDEGDDDEEVVAKAELDFLISLLPADEPSLTP
jgi:hypothetical protein